jgi:hypothetical protein
MSSRHIWNPWTFLRCRVLGLHHWKPVLALDDLDSGWRCRDCDEQLLKRHFVEKDYEPEITSPYWGRRQDPEVPSK